MTGDRNRTSEVPLQKSDFCRGTSVGNNMTGDKIKNKAGFTLIELLVAVTIFSILVGSASSAFLIALRSQQRALAQQDMLDHTRFALEFMSRKLRMGQRDNTGSCISSGNTYSASAGMIIFIASNDKCTRFRLTGGEIVFDEGPDFGSLSKVGELTRSSAVNIQQLDFTIAGESGADSFQPRATIVIAASAGDISRNFQTSVTQRNLDRP